MYLDLRSDCADVATFAYHLSIHQSGLLWGFIDTTDPLVGNRFEDLPERDRRAIVAYADVVRPLVRQHQESVKR